MTTAGNPEPAWTVTSQVETTDVGPEGSYVKGVKVAFRTATGATGSVFLPETAYTVEAVRQAINAKVDVLAAVSQLQG